MTPNNAVLHVTDVHKKFGGLNALSDIDLQVMEGTTHAIIGPNGAGKSTLLNVCIGRIAPDSGAEFCGEMRVHGAVEHDRLCPRPRRERVL